MANVDRPQGARPKGVLRRQNEYVASETIFPGDFVKQTADGKIARAAASDALCGVATDYAAADGDAINVADHPDQEFIVQANGTEISAQTALNLNYDIVATAGDTTYKVSRMELDSATGATTATLPLKATQVEKRPDNDFGDQADVVVMINNHQLSAGTGTAGI